MKKKESRSVSIRKNLEIAQKYKKENAEREAESEAQRKEDVKHTERTGYSGAGMDVTGDNSRLAARNKR